MYRDTSLATPPHIAPRTDSPHALPCAAPRTQARTARQTAAITMRHAAIRTAQTRAAHHSTTRASHRAIAAIIALTMAPAVLAFAAPAPAAFAEDADAAIAGAGANAVIRTVENGSDENADTPNAGTGATSEAPVQQPAGPVPNIIVTSFAYGGADASSVAAGARFDLTLTYQNMGKVAVGNMVITVDGGESFAIAGGTNTFYVEALGAGGANTLTVPMQAVPGAKSGAQGITVGFRYEYVDQGVRSSNSSEVRVTVPVSQPDRFDVTAPTVPDDGLFAGQEATLTMPYVNKGKGDVANVEATMEGEGFQATAATQYVGNVASGATGSIGYAFTPDAAGELKATLKVRYEDSDGNERTKEFPLTLTVADMPMTDPGMVDPGMMVDEEPGMPAWAWAAIAAAVAAVVIVAIVMIVRRRKKQAKAHDIDEEWDKWAKEDASGGAAAGTAAPSMSSVASAPDARPSPRSVADAPTMALDPVVDATGASDSPTVANPPATPAIGKSPAAAPRHGDPTPHMHTRANGGADAHPTNGRPTNAHPTNGRPA